VNSLDAFWAMKHARTAGVPQHYQPIEIPKNSPNGFVTAFFAVVTGFALIWHIWWMTILGLACAALTLFAFGWMERGEITVSGEQLAIAERNRMQREPA
jgi:cytochrome o ubiquinol oxidase subunit I